MSILKIASALPLVVGIACSTSGSQSKDHTGAMWSERKAASSEASMQGTGSGGSQDSAVVLTAADSSDKGSSSTGSMGSSGAMMGSSGSSEPSGSSGSMGSSDSSGSAGSGGGAMGSGGSSETMGAQPEKDSSAGTTGSSDTGAGAAGSVAGSAGETTAAGHGDQWVKGKVSKVSKDEVTIAPKKGETRTLKIADQTVVTINGKDAKPGQLKQGQQVRASYSSEGGEDVATKIMVGRARQGQHKLGTGGHMKGQGEPSGTPGSGSSGMGGSPGGSDTGSSGGGR